LLATKTEMTPLTSLAKEKLIIALDVDTAQQARDLFVALRDFAGMFKIGSQLFTAVGPGIVREIVSAGGRVFLDLKFHDIPNTVAAAGVEAARLGVSIFNVHASGGSEMMRRTADAVSEVSERGGLTRPRVIGVTVLTSSGAQQLAESEGEQTMEQRVIALAKLADASGLDGVVASPLEVIAIRRAVTRENFIIVTPGVRPAGAAADDQKRVMTPAAAIKAGSDYLVVGRPIVAAPDPVQAAREILADMAAA
jgi:orotidine-5'-phosphate decarboxylase